MTLARQDIPPRLAPTATPDAQNAASMALTRADHLLLSTGLSGVFLITLSALVTAVQLPAIQQGIAAADSAATWWGTAYLMSGMVGVVFSIVLIRGFGLGRYMIANSTLFTVAAMGAALASTPEVLVAFRALQGLAAGAFGSIAFVAVFTVMAGHRLPLGLTLLAFIIMAPIGLGAVTGDAINANWGWRGLFVLQALAGGGLALAAIRFIPRRAIVRSALKIDGVATFGLALGLALVVLVLTQGGRRSWLDDALIALSLAVAMVALVIFLGRTVSSPVQLFRPAILLTRRFGVPTVLNLVFRAGLAIPLIIAPQAMATFQGDPIVEIGQTMLWLTAAQIVSLPLAWTLLRRLDSRIIAAAGLLLCGFGGILAAQGRMEAMFAFVGAGQILFFTANLVISGVPLKSPDLPTASVAVNATSIIGAALGTAIAGLIGSERPGAPAVHGLDLPISHTLDFSDACLAIALLLALGAVAVLAIGSCPSPHVGPPRRASKGN
jgi:DHA2 family multidrug resistance protein